MTSNGIQCALPRIVPETVEADADKYTEMWKGLWSARDTAWHLTHRNPMLVKYQDKLLDGKSPVKLLFPFCGKVIDMKYFWEQGHNVFGVDCAPEAIKDFYAEQKIEYDSKELGKGTTLFSSKDGRLNLINTNFYTLDNPMLNGSVECVWDRGAFGTITEDEQKLYINSIRKLLAPNFRYLLLVLEFDDSQWSGVPFSQPEEKVRRFYGDFCEIEKLEARIPEHLSLYQKHMQGPLEVKETVYFLTPKKN